MLASEEQIVGTSVQLRNRGRGTSTGETTPRRPKIRPKSRSLPSRKLSTSVTPRMSIAINPRSVPTTLPSIHRPPLTSTTTPSTHACANDRPSFEPQDDQRFARRPASDDRETIGQILQALQKSRPPATSTLATCSPACWIVGCRPADRCVPARRCRRLIGQGGGALGAGWPCCAVLRAGAAVLLPRQPRLARPGNAHDRAVDGAGRDPLLRARKRRQRLDGDGRPGDPPRSRRDGRRRRARDCACRRTRNPRRQRSLRARARLLSTTKSASARCCRTSRISATTWSVRPNRFAPPFPACRSISATTSR